MRKVSSQSVKFDLNGVRFKNAWYYLGSFSDVECVLFLGSGQFRRQARIIARQHPGVAVVPAPPHWCAAADGRDTQRFMNSYAEAMMQAVQKDLRRKIKIIADSQSAPSMVSYTLKNPDMVAQLVLLQPLGLNTHAFWSVAAERLEELGQRIRRNYHQELPRAALDVNWLGSQFGLAYVVARYSLHRKRKLQYDAGLRHSLCPELLQLEGRVPVSVVSGSDDKIFPPAEMDVALREHGLSWIGLQTVPGIAHTALSSKNGNKLLRATGI